MDKLHRKPLLLLLTIFTIVFAFIIYPKDFLGWIVFGGLYSLLILNREIYEDKPLFISFFLVITLHQCVSLLNAYHFHGLMHGAELDALTFYKTASQYAEQNILVFDTDSNAYLSVLSLFFRLNDSLFLGQELSIVAVFFSMIYLIKIIKLLQARFESKAIAVFLFGIWGGGLLFTSVILREAWQILYLMTAFYYGVIAYKQSMIFTKETFLFAISVFLFSCLHGGSLLLITPFMFLLPLIYFSLYQRYPIKIYRLKCLLSILFLVSLTWFSTQYDTITLSITQSITHSVLTGEAGKWTNRSEEMLSTAPKGESFYVWYGAWSGPHHSLRLAIINKMHNWLCYNFGPFPWQIKGSFYIPFMFFGMLRLLIVIFVLYYALFKAKDRQERFMLAVLFLIYCALTGVWSLGTLNYGTAIRHLVTTDWMLIVMLGVTLRLQRSESFLVFEKTHDERNACNNFS